MTEEKIIANKKKMKKAMDILGTNHLELIDEGVKVFPKDIRTGGVIPYVAECVHSCIFEGDYRNDMVKRIKNFFLKRREKEISRLKKKIAEIESLNLDFFKVEK